MTLAKNIAIGRKSIAAARQRGIDTSGWEAVLADLEQQQLLAWALDWAGADPQLWGKVLRILKRTWQPLLPYPDSPRHVLVAWARANERLVSARAALDKLRRSPFLTARERVSKEARQADISFYGRLKDSLYPRATRALTDDSEARTLLEKLSRGDRERGRT